MRKSQSGLGLDEKNGELFSEGEKFGGEIQEEFGGISVAGVLWFFGDVNTDKHWHPEPKVHFG